jgi:Tfp pilus assembly protein PilF
MPLSDKIVRRLLRPVIYLLSLVVATSCSDKQSDLSKTHVENTNLVWVPATNSTSFQNTAPSSNSKSTALIPLQAPLSPEDQSLQDAVRLDSRGQDDSAMEEVNSVLKANPKNITAYTIRAQIYAKKKLWDQTGEDCETVLQIDSKNIAAQFDLSELKFRQKAYDEARAGFLILEKDPDLGDLSSYKAFLCDLYGGKDAVAQSELDAFSKVGANPSF